jgi:hypothetical protein
VPAISVSTWVPAAEPAAKDEVTPLGKPVAESATLPENPPTLVTVMVLVPLPPWATETDMGEGDSVKSAATLTVTVTLPVTVL